MSPREIRRASQKLTAILANNLRLFRRKHQLSQEQFAELCGLHRTYIGSVERCERNVTLSTLEVFATVLKTTVPELLTDHDVNHNANLTHQMSDSV